VLHTTLSLTDGGGWQVTTFSLRANRYTDPESDLPLTYEFGAALGSAFRSATVVLRAAAAGSSASVRTVNVCCLTTPRQ
jgi:hypothetical protein